MLKRIIQFFRADIPCFFNVTLPLFLNTCSLGTKILISLLCGLMIYLLLFGAFFGAIMLLGTKTFDLELSQSSDQIAQIEIIHVDEDDDYQDHEFKNVTVCAVIDEDRLDAFLADLNNVTCRSTGFDASPNIYGPTIRIIYRDGTFDLLSGSGFFQSADAEYPYVRRVLDFDELLELLTAYGYQNPTPSAPSRAPDGPTLPSHKR